MEAMKQLVPLFLFTSALMLLPGHAAETYEKVCYVQLGCFSNAPPFTSPQRSLSFLPQSPDKIRTTYILYTREWRTVPQILDARFPETFLDVWTNFTARPTKFIVHGFFQTVRKWSWMRELAEELLKDGDYNVIVVDWSGGNQFPYAQAAANTRIIGAQISELVKHLIEVLKLTADDFHIIGHSLGAQIAGYAGQRITGLGRISGLDPADPYFRDTDRSVRLDDTDAKFVDVVHTEVPQKFQFGWGTPTLSGHVDFFPNSGYDQPGCGGIQIFDILESGLVKGVADSVFCSHMRAVEFYNQSINSPCPFLAFPCASEENFKNNRCQTCGSTGCSHMGFHADKYKPPQGQTITYYVTTGSDPPFCVYHYTVIVKFSSGSWPSVSGRPSVVISGDAFKSALVSLTGDKAVNFAPGQSSSFYLDLPQNVGKVVAVFFKWEKEFSLLTLFEVPSVTVDSIMVFSHEDGTRFQFCGQGRSVKSGSSIILVETC